MPFFKTENGNAENIKYDDTKSVKEVIDDVQTAIEEVRGGVNSNLSVRYNADTDCISVYYNGSWIDALPAYVQWSGAIYNSGTFDERSGITGAYTELQKTSGSTIYLEANRISLRSVGLGSSMGIARMKFTNAIDFTNIKSISCVVTHSYVRYMEQSIPGLYIKILDASNNVQAQLLIREACTNKTFTLNTANLNGRYYICFDAQSGSWSTSSYGNSYITKIDANL